MGFIREDKTNGDNNNNNEIKTISSKVLATVPASNVKLDNGITVNNVSINKDRRYYIEFLGSKKLCSVMISEDMGNSIICSIKGYVIQAINIEQSTNLILFINNTNAENIPISTNLVIYEEEIKCLDNKYLETDLVLQNSISLGRVGSIGAGSSAVGAQVEASGNGSHAEGYKTTTSAPYSHAEGGNSTASGDTSHAEGDTTTASGDNSHAEGGNSTASGYSSHAEGSSTEASGYSSHAEGGNSTASGYFSHAEGSSTEASGDYSHAEGNNTIASSESQHVQGKYNIEDTANKYAHIVGNGEFGNRSNAHTLDWEGNAWYAGKLSQEGTPTEDKDLTTKKYVDDNTVILPLPIHTIQETNSVVIKVVNIMDLIKGVAYSTHNDPNETRNQSYRVVYICDDGTFKIICTLPLANRVVHLLKVVHTTKSNYSTLSYNNTAYKVDYSKHSTNTDVEITKTLQNYLPIANITEYNPTKEYHPATKKYVDDKITVKILPVDYDNGKIVNVKNLEAHSTYKCPNDVDFLDLEYEKESKLVAFLMTPNTEQLIYVGNKNDKQIELIIGVYSYIIHFKTETQPGSMERYVYYLTPNNNMAFTPTKDYNPVHKKYVDDKINDTLVTTNISGTTLSLTTDKYQTTTIVDGTEITLPTVTSFKEIHLFFNTATDLTLILPSCKWQNGNTPTIVGNKTYEFIFTYTTEWLGVVIVYG